ncbi:MAG: type 4a pilus biogenesis protein PilO [Acidobacteriota bacterium]|nr:type 4a pilus biogenesis protein PilO [Acidobacteriota bacterium]
MASLSFGKIPWQGQLGIFVAVSLAAAGAFYYYYEMPRQAAIATQAVELSAIRARISTGQATARQLPEFRAQVTELEARLDSLKPILPDERDAGDLLRRVQTLAVQSNLVIRGFRPQAIAMREMHAEWPISLQLEGTYHNLGLFLDRVSKFPRIINIGGLTLAQREGGGSSTMTIACTATTFVLVEQPATPAAAKGKKAPKKAPAKK